MIIVFNYIVSRKVLNALIAILVVLWCFGLSESCLATDSFRDDFDTLSSEVWDVQENLGTATIDSGVLRIGSTSLTFPSILDRGILNDHWIDGTTLEMRFRYVHTGPMGSGIGIGYTGTDRKPYYQFAFWNDSHSSKMFYVNDFFTGAYHLCSSFGTQEYPGMFKYWRILDIGDDEWITLRLEKSYRKYVISYRTSGDYHLLYESNPDYCVPKSLFIGNPLSAGSYDWSNMEFDYLRVFDSDQVEQQKKVIVIPGMGASWNSKAIVYNETVADNEWTMTPFVRSYDGLTDALEENGLIRDQDYFVWNYDWRRPIADNVSRFDAFVDLNVPGGEKVDVVGHSMGGLIGRIWSQNNIDDSRIGKVVTLGSPHFGAVQTYEVWNGGSVGDLTDPAGIALNVLLEIQGGSGANRARVIRDYAPSIHDILPTFDYQRRNGVLVSVATTAYKNDYLRGKSILPASLYDVLLQGVGVGLSTKEYLVLGGRTSHDAVLGLWEDGRIQGQGWGSGDKTVLSKSAKFNLMRSFEINSSHGEIVDRSLANVMQEIGLSMPTDSLPAESLTNKIVFFVGSPVSMKVDCGQGEVSSTDFVVVDALGSCRVLLEGTSSGKYHLVWGLTGDDNWRYVLGDASEGSVDELWIDTDTADINLGKSRNYLKNIIKTDLASLGMTSSAVKVDGDNFSGVLIDVFLYRKLNRENLVTLRIIDNLEVLLSDSYVTTTKTAADKRYLLVTQERSLVDAMTRLKLRYRLSPSQFGAESYTLASERIVQMAAELKQGSYGDVMAKGEIASKFLSEVWPK